VTRKDKILAYIEILPKLGLWDVLYVLRYRLDLKFGLNRYKFPSRKTPLPSGEFFKEIESSRIDYPEEWKEPLIARANSLLNGDFEFYSHHHIAVGAIPSWFTNHFNGKEVEAQKYHWTKIPDFTLNVGDIKHVWELSRFTWLNTLSRAYAISADERYLNRINQLLQDWSEKNPKNFGPNWKCGQETSFRIFNVLMAAAILDQECNPSNILIEFVKDNISRVEKNVRYAIAQRNNHATSEVGALYIAGIWLRKVDPLNKRRYSLMIKRARGLLVRLCDSLFYEDGGFAQHSVTYHRVVLHTFLQIEYWRIRLEAKALPNKFYSTSRAAFRWLHKLCDPQTGDCPNLGANDGANILQLHSQGYRDFREVIQAGMELFLQCSPYERTAAFNETSYWLNTSANKQSCSDQQNSELLASGICILRSKQSTAFIRYPFYKFRPGQNDAMHFDLWFNSENILPDSGTFSYNPDKDLKLIDFKSVKAHNTLAFDGQEQMPRLSRFLLGKWIEPDSIGSIRRTEKGQSWKATYRNYLGNRHERRIFNEGDNWFIEDHFSGGAEGISVGFNLNTKDSPLINQEDNSVRCSWGTIKVDGAESLQIVKTQISLYYNHYIEIPRLEINTKNNSILKTSIYLQS